MTVTQLIEAYLAHARVYYRKPGSRRLTREYHVIRPALHGFRQVAGDLPVEDIRAETVIAYRRSLLERGSCCRSTINAYVSRVVRMVRWAADPESGRLVPPAVLAEVLVVRPLAYGRSAARESEGLTAITYDQLTDFLASCSDTHPRLTRRHTLTRRRLAAMAELQDETCMRPGELCAMHFEDLDVSRDEDGVWLYTPREHKTDWRGKSRIIVLSYNAQSILRGWLTISGITSGPIFGITPHAYRLGVTRQLKRAGLEHWTPQQIRHKGATRVRKAHGLEAARIILGHSSDRMTRRYTKSAETDGNEIIAELKARGALE